MKKMILSLLAVGAVASAQAQRDGSILIYGNAGIQTTKNTFNAGVPGSVDQVNKTTNWQFEPGVGYNFNNKWAAGLNINLSGGKETWEPSTPGSVSDVKTFDLAVGPFVRYTHDFNKMFFAYKQLNVSYLRGKETFVFPSPSTDIENTYSGFSINVMPAVGVNLNHHFAITFNVGGLGYQSVTWDNEGTSENKESGFTLDFGRGFMFGLQANLGGVTRKAKGYIEPGTEHRMMDTSDDDDDNVERKIKIKRKVKTDD